MNVSLAIRRLWVWVQSRKSQKYFCRVWASWSLFLIKNIIHVQYNTSLGNIVGYSTSIEAQNLCWLTYSTHKSHLTLTTFLFLISLVKEYFNSFSHFRTVFNSAEYSIPSQSSENAKLRPRGDWRLFTLIYCNLIL